MTYNQSGFDLDEKRGHDKYAYVRFSKIGWVRIRYSRPIPDRATIKEVTVKKETTGEWFVSFGLETDDTDLPEKPDVDSLDTSNSVGIDLGILNYIHTSDGKTVDWLDLEDDYECLRRGQRKLSRKKRGRTTTRNSVGRLPKSSAGFVRRCWITSTNSRRGSSVSTTPCSLKI